MGSMSKQTHKSAKAPSQRQLRVGELIRRNLATILTRGDIHDAELNRMSMTVGEVRCTPDLRQATVFVLPLGGGDYDEALHALWRNKSEIRHMLGKAVEMKHTPELKFIIDRSFDQFESTRDLLNDDRVRRDVES